MNKQTLINILPLLPMATLGTKAVAQSNVPQRPNILFILSDDHTSQTWGIYGGILADYVSTPTWEFYDLQADPHEDHNAINDKQYQKIIKQMKQEMMRLRQEYNDTDEGSVRMHQILREQGLEK